jgi:hypothetical protein
MYKLALQNEEMDNYHGRMGGVHMQDEISLID